MLLLRRFYNGRMLLKCQKEPFLQQFVSTVVECNEVKKGKKKQYEVVLEDTILFAEGGGQPCDYGTFYVTSADEPSKSINVVDVQRKDGRAVHIVSEQLNSGLGVVISVDWKRRYDHMQQHTGQHLLSAVAEQMFQYKTVSWNLGLKISHVELNTPSIENVTKMNLENEINRLIQKGLPVTTHLYKNKSDPALSTAHTRGLPADHTGPVRVVEIKGVDENMCCGTHLLSLSQIQMIKLMHTESKRGNTLLYFVCGDRVLETLQNALDVQCKLNALLSSPPDKFASLVEKLANDSRAHRKESERANEEVAQLLAGKLKTSTEKVLHLHRDSINQEFSLTIQRELRDIYENDKLFLLTMGEAGSAQFVFRGPPEVVDKLGKELAAKLGGKGGGRDGKFQGKFTDLSLIESSLNFLKESY